MKKYFVNTFGLIVYGIIVYVILLIIFRVKSFSISVFADHCGVISLIITIISLIKVSLIDNQIKKIRAIDSLKNFVIHELRKFKINVNYFSKKHWELDLCYNPDKVRKKVIICYQWIYDLNLYIAKVNASERRFSENINSTLKNLKQVLDRTKNISEPPDTSGRLPISGNDVIEIYNRLEIFMTSLRHFEKEIKEGRYE